MKAKTLIATSALILLGCSTEHDAIVDECVEVLDSYALLFSLSKDPSSDELDILEERFMELVPRTRSLVSNIKKNLDDMRGVDSRRIAPAIRSFNYTRNTNMSPEAYARLYEPNDELMSELHGYCIFVNMTPR